MRPLVRALLTIATLVGTLSFVSIALPKDAFACSCARVDDRLFTGQEDAVLAGVVGQHEGGGRYAFAVERWFKGGAEPSVPMQSARVPEGNGNFSFSTCGLDLEPGQHWILSAQRTNEGLAPSACGTHAELGTPEGQVVFAAAVRAFGNGTVPGAGPSDAPVAQSFDLAQLAIVLVAPIFAIVVLVVVVAAFRARDSSEGAG